MNPLDEGLLYCPSCGSVAKATDTFCGQCGKEIFLKDKYIVKEDVFKTLLPTLLYYFTTLILLAAYKLTSIFPEGVEGILWITVLDILIVIIFWANSFDETKRLFSFANLRLKVITLTVIGAIVGSMVVSLAANFINLSINDDVFYDTYLFEGTAYPFLFATLMIAVQPAIFEEVAFRGFLFDNLKKIAGGNSAIYISGFVFGIMHLQIISLIWLVPIGLAFGFLRNKYNTLWYGIIGHFTYNFFITLYEFQGWF
jgi:uncharacterized protein